MESFLATLKEQVKCSLCKETLNGPKLLPCFHVFCTSCIEGHLQLNEEHIIFHCPECNSETVLQDLNDIHDLQTSPIHSRILKVLEFIESEKICSVSSSHPEALWLCLDCDRSLCEQCVRSHSEFTNNHQVVSLCDLKEEDINVMLKKELPCEVHDRHIVESHCQDCDVLICALCTKSHHHNHKTATLQDFVNTEKDLLSTILADIDEISTEDDKKKKQEDIAVQINSEAEKAEQEVKELTKKLIKTLKDNEQQLLNKIHNAKTKAETNLRVVRHTTQAQEYIKYFMENGTASEMIDNRQNKSSQNVTYDPFDHTDPGVKFTPNQELCEQVERGLGQVRTYIKKADPKMSSVRVEPSELEATKKAHLIINLKTSKREDTDEALKNVYITFTPRNSVENEVLQMANDSEITLDFTPRYSGPILADIKLHGNPVSDSPLAISIKPQLMKEQTEDSKLMEALRKVTRFTNIAVNKEKNRIVVANSSQLNVFDIQGDIKYTLNISTRFRPSIRSLAFLTESTLAIVVFGSNEISIFNIKANKLEKGFGCSGNTNGAFDSPCWVHVDEELNILVCDTGNNRVQVFTKDGVYLYQFSVPAPLSVVKHNGLFYVSDGSNNVVCVIRMLSSLSFTTVATIGGQNYTDGRLARPQGLAIDNENNLLVCDNLYSSIFKFSPEGRFVGRSIKLTSEPRHIAVLNDGRIICSTSKGVVFLK